MENLTKQQIILLTLLVSFVTSMATGIITVSLMDQAPAGVTQTINRVVERTIEKVVPQIVKSDPVTVRETIIVNEGDQITKAIETNNNVIVRLYKKTGEVENFVGLGVWISSDGKIIFPDALNISGSETLVAISSDGSKYNLTSVSSSSTDNKISVYKAVTYVNSTSTISTNFPKANLSSSAVKLGQTVVVLSGDKKNIVMNGIVSSLENVITNIVVASSSASSTLSQIATTTDNYIQTSVDNNTLFTGSILMNLTGEVVGLRDRNGTLFIPASVIKREFAVIK